MKSPDPCEPAKRLVDKLREQLDALCSVNQEDLFFQGLVDVHGLTETTRALLKDAERRWANCRRDRLPPSDRPFLITFTDPNCSPGFVETHQGEEQTSLGWRVAAYAGFGVFVLSLGYVLHEHRVMQSFAAQNKQELTSLNAARSQIASLTMKLKSLDTRPGSPLDQAADATVVHRTSPSQRTEDRYVRRPRVELDAQGRASADTRRGLSATHDDLTSKPTEPTGSIAEAHDELALLQPNGERNYYEFDIDKSTRFQKDGPLGIRLKKANSKHQYADLELQIEDRDVSQKHVNLNQAVMFYMPDSPQPVGLVINSISKNHVHGYVSKPKYHQSGLASTSNANIPDMAVASQTLTRSDARVRPAQDRGRLRLLRRYWFWKSKQTQ